MILQVVISFLVLGSGLLIGVVSPYYLLELFSQIEPVCAAASALFIIGSGVCLAGGLKRILLIHNRSAAFLVLAGLVFLIHYLGFAGGGAAALGLAVFIVYPLFKGSRRELCSIGLLYFGFKYLSLSAFLLLGAGFAEDGDFLQGAAARGVISVCLFLVAFLVCPGVLFFSYEFPPRSSPVCYIQTICSGCSVLRSCFNCRALAHKTFCAFIRRLAYRIALV